MFVTREPLPISETVKKQADASCGAQTFFVGVVRNRNEGKAVEKLYYECYEPMANRQIALVIANVKKRWGVTDIQVHHRVGWLNVGEAAVIVAVNAPHRDEAFSACRAVMDDIKATVPIWKKEVYADGTNEWVLCSHQATVTS